MRSLKIKRLFFHCSLFRRNKVKMSDKGAISMNPIKKHKQSAYAWIKRAKMMSKCCEGEFVFVSANAEREAAARVLTNSTNIVSNQKSSSDLFIFTNDWIRSASEMKTKKGRWITPRTRKWKTTTKIISLRWNHTIKRILFSFAWFRYHI